MAAYETITAGRALSDLQNGALLVNGYDVQEKWDAFRVPDAISYMDFAHRADSLPRNTEVMFYCA